MEFSVYDLIFVFLCFSFCLGLFLWNIYLMRQNSILINKLMSRDYNDYVLSEKQLLPKAEEISEEEPVSAYDNQRARDLNSYLGLG